MSDCCQIWGYFCGLLRMKNAYLLKRHDWWHEKIVINGFLWTVTKKWIAAQLFLSLCNDWSVGLLFFIPFHCSTAISICYSRRYEIFGQFLKRLSAKIFYMMMPAAVLITTTLLSTSWDTVKDFLWEMLLSRILRLRIRLWMTQRPI